MIAKNLSLSPATASNPPRIQIVYRCYSFSTTSSSFHHSLHVSSIASSVDYIYKAFTNPPSTLYLHQTDSKDGTFRPTKNLQPSRNNRREYCNEEILCRLIHFWEARHFKLGNILMGYELLLIDLKGNTIQGFISANRLFHYERDLKANSVYNLKKFMVKPCEPLYKTSDHKHRVLFTDQTTMAEVPTGASSIDHQRFRIRPFSDFSTIAGTKTNLFGKKIPAPSPFRKAH